MSQALTSRFETMWQRSDELFAMLSPEALLEQPIALRQPFLFYVGHLPGFARIQLRVLRGLAPHESDLDALFARGIDPVGVDSYAADAHAWPALQTVIDYRDRARDELRAAFDEADDADPGVRQAFGTIVEHELMHHETLLYMIQQLAADKRRSPPLAPVTGPGRPGGAVAVAEGNACLGAAPGERPFVWDNEIERHGVVVPAFRIDRTPVTNGQFLEFVEAGGFEREDLWTSAGWAWRQRCAVVAPPQWRRRDAGWRYATLSGDLPLEAVRDWPVSVSHATACAYARWRGARLPTEAEYHRAAYATPAGALRPYPWGAEAPDASRANVGFVQWAPTPAGTHPEGASAWGVEDLVGDGWEWTETVFAPFPGFAPQANYPGYSADFFDGEHYVMLGGSWATDAALVRRSFRNWFQPHYPWMFATFRCVWAGS